MIEAEPLAQLDYVGVVDAATMADLDPLVGEIRLLAAARFGKARLLDNVGITVPEVASSGRPDGRLKRP
jgi:pantoate--beta-alanine ligase